MGSTLTQFASLIFRSASAWVDGPCGQVLCHAPGPCTDGSDEPPPWPHQDEMPVAWCSSRLAFRSGVFFCAPLRVFSSPGSCTQRGWVLSRASPRSPSRLAPAALARMQATHGSHCTCATGPCRPAVPLLFLLSASAGGRALSLKAPRSCDPSRRPPSWCDIFPHATAHDVHGVSLHVPFLLLGGAAPSVFSLFFLPHCCCVAFLKKSVALVSRPPLTNPPALMQFLEHTHGAQYPCTCGAVALLPRVLWSRPPHWPCRSSLPAQGQRPCRSCDMASHAPASVVESVQLLLFCFGGALIFLSFPLRVDRIACDSEA